MDLVPRIRRRLTSGFQSVQSISISLQNAVQRLDS